jgi:hypothetical protein
MNRQSCPVRRGFSGLSGHAQSTRPSVSDTIRLILGEPPEPLSWRALSSIARIVVAPDDRPIRTIITGRRRITTGAYMSAKAGRSLPFEGMNEQALFMHCEVDTRIVDYRAQPFRFEFVVDGARRVYITDCARLLESGRIEIIEVKNDRRALKDPDYALKLACVRDICGRLGWSFRVVVKQQLFEPTNLYANVVEIQSRRRMRFDRSHVLPALDIIRRAGGQVPLGMLAEAIGERRQGTAIAQAMMVARLVEIDMSRPISVHSAVRAVDPARSSRQMGAVS